MKVVEIKICIEPQFSETGEAWEVANILRRLAGELPLSIKVDKPLGANHNRNLKSSYGSTVGTFIVKEV